MTTYSTPPPTELTEEAKQHLEAIKSADVTVLCGPNNSGKSFVLRQVFRTLGPDATYLGPARYNNFNTLAPYGPQPNRKTKRYQEALRHLQNASQNVDNSPLNLQQAIAELSDERRQALFSILRELLGVDASIESTIPNNSMAQKYVSVDGHNLSFTSSGLRLVTTLITSLMNPDHKFVLIDEPELGLSPEVQATLAEWFLDPSTRSKYLPHLDGVVLATHSPIFLDRVNLARNYQVSRTDNVISLAPLQSLRDLTELQFSLLGNRFETLLLPSAIVLVEGITDHAYLSRVISLSFPDAHVSVVTARGDGRMSDVVAMAQQMLGDLQRSPYADRLFAVVDSAHGTGLQQRLVAQGINPDNIVVWSRNGIEFLYPAAHLEQIFGEHPELNIDDDRVSANGHTFTKAELARKIGDSITSETVFPDELRAKLLEPLRRLLPPQARGPGPNS